MSQCSACNEENTLYNPRTDAVAVFFPRLYLTTCSACRAESTSKINYGAKPPERPEDDCNIYGD